MKLFRTNQNVKPISNSSLVLQTALGFCECEYEFQERQMFLPSLVEQTEKGDLLATWENSYYLMECLKISFQPTLSDDLYVDECFAFIWRVAVKNKICISWKCCLAPSYEGVCETGENMVSCIFEEKTTTLSIGTEDEEMLVCRAKKNLWMPDRLKDHITEKNVLCLTNGLKICFDKLLPGDHLQIHFLIAWSALKKRSVSTWTAVEQPYNILLQQAGFF